MSWRPEVCARRAPPQTNVGQAWTNPIPAPRCSIGRSGSVWPLAVTLVNDFEKDIGVQEDRMSLVEGKGAIDDDTSASADNLIVCRQDAFAAEFAKEVLPRIDTGPGATRSRPTSSTAISSGSGRGTLRLLRHRHSGRPALRGQGEPGWRHQGAHGWGLASRS